MYRIRILIALFAIFVISGLSAQTKSKYSPFSFEDAAVTLLSPKSVSLDASGWLGERFYANMDYHHE